MKEGGQGEFIVTYRMGLGLPRVRRTVLKMTKILMNTGYIKTLLCL